MEYFKIAASSLIAIATLFILSKIVGQRQISQLSMFDYINGITIGNIGGELAISKGKEMLEPFIAMIVFFAAVFFLSVITNKSITARRVITGKPIFLMRGGKLFKENMKKAKTDLGELLAMCRNQGYFDMSQIEDIIFEHNGTISILPVTAAIPPKAQDLNIETKQEKAAANIIIDGNIMEENLSAAGYDAAWLAKQLKEAKLKVGDVFLGVCGSGEKPVFFTYEDDERKDIFS